MCAARAMRLSMPGGQPKSLHERSGRPQPGAQAGRRQGPQCGPTSSVGIRPGTRHVFRGGLRGTSQPRPGPLRTVRYPPLGALLGPKPLSFPAEPNQVWCAAHRWYRPSLPDSDAEIALSLIAFSPVKSESRCRSSGNRSLADRLWERLQVLGCRLARGQRCC
jgi:hypothetical protein